MDKKTIADLRVALDKTQPEFASLMGVSVNTVRSWEKRGEGRREAPEMAFKLARLYLDHKKYLD